MCSEDYHVTRGLVRSVFALVSTLCLLPWPLCAQTYVGSTTGTNQWTNSANWSGASIPNATNATVVFTNVGTLHWTNATVTVGTINFNNTSGNVVIGNNSITNDILNLATTSGTPILNVTNGGTAFIYADVIGTNGFTKNGAGKLTWRFNTYDQSYSGNIFVNAGTLGIDRDGSLGNTNNDLFFNGNSTFLIEPGANTGTVTLGAGRTVTISNGVTLTLQNGTTNVATVINGQVTGAGSLTLKSAGVAGLNVYTLNGTNNFTGTTTIEGNSKLILGSGSSISTNALSLSGGSSANNTYILDLGGNSQNVASLTAASSSAYVRTLIISNGSLSVTAPSANYALNGTNGTTLNFSNLTSFQWNGAAGGRNFTLTPDGALGSTGNTNYVYLASSGAGSNKLSGNNLVIGGATGSPTPDNQAQFMLGKVNDIFFEYARIGGFNGSGVVALQLGITNGVLNLRGSNGVSRMGTLIVGETSSGTRSGAGTLNLSNGTIDALVNNAYIGIFGASSTGPTTSNSITMGGGTFDALNLTMATITNTSITNASATVTAVFQQNGGAAKIGKLTLGDSQTAINTSAPVLNAIYNLSAQGATLYASNIAAGNGTNFASGSVRKINFGAGTIRNYDNATDLVINGLNTNASGRIEVALSSNANTRTFYADAGRRITVGTNAVLTYNGGFIKDGDGTMEIQSTDNNYTGATEVNDGTLIVNGSIASSSGATVNSGATLGGSGTVSALTIASGGTLSPGNSPGTLTASSATWNGGGTYVWEINNFLGLAGTNWDFLNVTGSLTISASSGNRFIIDIVSLLASNLAGDAENFDAFSNYSFAIATAAGGITGFSSSYFDILTSGFSNSMSPDGSLTPGFWGISQDGSSIMLNYTAATAIPEPGTGGLLLVGLGVIATLRRRLRS